MLGLDREVAAVTGPPTAERVQALKRILPGATIRAIPKRTGQTQPCRRLPTWFMVWFVIGLGLFATDCYRQVFRWLQRCRRRRTPARTTRCEARRRLGVAPVRALMDRIVRLLATPRTPGACYCGLRLMALDGFVVDLPDTAANGRAFGRPHNGRAPAAFPPARVPARCAVGTHVLWKCPVKPKHRAEIRLAAALPRFLAPDRLLLWGRGFCSDDNVRDVAARRAHVPARAQSTRVRAKVRALADGSDLARLYPSAKHRRKDRDGLLVRAIDYTVGDRGRPGAGAPRRLLTALLGPRRHPARRLIPLYHERWEEELAIDELKTHQRQRPVLRSQTPAGVVQELYGLLLAHFVVRRRMAAAAAARRRPPRRLSFTGALKIWRCRLPECPRGARGRRRWYQDLLAEMAEETVAPRRERVNPRVIRRKLSKWPKKRPEHRHYPPPTQKFGDALEVLS